MDPNSLPSRPSQQFPFGMDPNFDSDKLIPLVGHPCTLFLDDLTRYMMYTMNRSCHDDELSAQKLLLKGWKPLPRHRCRPAAAAGYVEQYPLPEDQWNTPSDSLVVWTAYTCKDYSYLINRGNIRSLMTARIVLTIGLPRK